MTTLDIIVVGGAILIVAVCTYVFYRLEKRGLRGNIGVRRNRPKRL